MKMIELKSVQPVHGITRHPNDGPIAVSDIEGKRLIDDEGVAIDVTENYSPDQLANLAPHLIGQ